MPANPINLKCFMIGIIIIMVITYDNRQKMYFLELKKYNKL